MISYHNSFTYLGINSEQDKDWMVVSFDSQSGESDSYLTREQIYSDSYDGTKRLLYGGKYSDNIIAQITVIKKDRSDFSTDEIRQAYKWLTGNPSSEWMDFYIGDELKYRLLCTIQDVRPYKMDSRTIGLTIYCESLSPWCYSPTQTITQPVYKTNVFTINNLSDDMYIYTPINVKCSNTDGTYVKIINNSIGEITEIKNTLINEVITLSNNMTITSDSENRPAFGSDFNFIFPRLKTGVNEITIETDSECEVEFEYVYCIKMGDLAIDINSVSDPICDSDGNITIDMLSWDRVSNTPTTLEGYGINDAYTKAEVNDLLPSISPGVNGEDLQNMLDEIFV